VIGAAYPSLAKMIERQIAAFPDNEEALQKRFAKDDEAHLRLADDLARLILLVAGPEVDTICADYRWLANMVLQEEDFFRRNGRYRLSKFQDALDQVYNDRVFMTRYMNGLLATQLWWRNHTEVLGFFRDRFVAENAPGFSHLEVGPGHGLFLYMAAMSPRCGSAEGWDISDASLAGTRKALDAMEVKRDVALRKVDLFASPAGSFQSIAFSEVLEHLEQPLDALRILHGLLADGGRIFVNAPVNSPAPDHLFLFRTPEEVAELVEKAGFTVVETKFAPCTGSSLERARKFQMSISAAVIATKRAP
jgi:2-polyprenyl-3-methyl-5-hydroxy-6-metoxy-1,4-benzoquinol methylase